MILDKSGFVSPNLVSNKNKKRRENDMNIKYTFIVKLGFKTKKITIRIEW